MLDGTGEAVAHYGSPLKEGRDFEAGRALVWRGDFRVLEISGADCLSWLNSFTTQKLRELKPGQSTETLILSPQGKIEQQIGVIVAPNSVLLIVAAHKCAELFEFLTRMQFALKVELRIRQDLGVLEFTAPVYAVADTDINSLADKRTSDNSVNDITAETDIVAHLAAQSPVFAAVQRTLKKEADYVGSDELLLKTGYAGDRELPQKTDAEVYLWCDPWSWQPPCAQYYHGTHPAASRGVVRLLVSDVYLHDVIDQLQNSGLKIAGINAANAFEVSIWRPSLAEFDERSLPHEYDLLRSSVHLQKGCYRGQETVAKVHNLGHPPRRLVFVHIDGSAGELPAAGDKLYVAASAALLEIKPVGKLTRVVMHHELGPVALALVKRAAPEKGNWWVEAADGTEIAASVETIVPPDAGAVNALSPEIRRALLER